MYSIHTLPRDSKVLSRSITAGQRSLGTSTGCRNALNCVSPLALLSSTRTEWNVFTNTRISCTMWLVKPFFKNMWAGPLSTTSLINNLLPGCCVDKLSSFHHLCHPHLLPSPTHAASPRTSKFIYQEFLGGGKWAGGRKEESDCSKNQNYQLKPITCCMLGHTRTKPQHVLKVTQRLAWSHSGILELPKSCRTFWVALKWTEIHPGADRDRCFQPCPAYVAWWCSLKLTFPGFMIILKGQLKTGLVKIPLQC